MVNIPNVRQASFSNSTEPLKLRAEGSISKNALDIAAGNKSSSKGALSVTGYILDLSPKGDNGLSQAVKGSLSYDGSGQVSGSKIVTGNKIDVEV